MGSVDASPPDQICIQHLPVRVLVSQLAPGHMLRSGGVTALICNRDEGNMCIGCNALWLNVQATCILRPQRGSFRMHHRWACDAHTFSVIGKHETGTRVA